jgi:hypothetical protein
MKQFYSLTELEKARKDGYLHDFVFADGHVFYVAHPEKKYAIAIAEKDPRPCLITETIVYRIELPDGLKGCAVESFVQGNDE